MNLDLSLAAMPLWLSFLLVVVLPTGLTTLGLVLIRRRFPTERLKVNNEVASFTFATVSVIYAVLLGFAVIVVWEKFRDAENAVSQEAASVVALYRLSDGMGGDAAVELRSRLTAYVRSVLDDDWPAMVHGHTSHNTTRALNDVYGAALKSDPAGARDSAVLAEIFHQLDQITQARRERIVVGAGVVPGMIWAVLVMGGAMTTASAFFFGSENLRAQLLMTGMLSTIVFTALLVIVSINYPFTGPVSVSPEPFNLALQDFAKG